MAAHSIIAGVISAACGLMLIGQPLATQQCWAADAKHPAAATAPALAAAEPGGHVRAIVIGIDNYQFAEPKLQGAVADARDLENVLKRAGVQDLTAFYENKATRSALEAALNALVERSGPGDLVIMTFAGHGSREFARGPGPTSGPLNQFFVLWGYDRQGAVAAEERLLDKYVFAWLKRITGKGAHVLLLADSCFGGGMTKAVDPRVTLLPVRALRGSELVAAPSENGPELADIPFKDNATAELQGVTFIAAVDDHTEAPEINVVDTPRGAASYALARALEGSADADGNRDGITTRKELLAYVRRKVRALSQNVQSPVVEPRTLETAEVPVFRIKSPAAFAAVPKVEAPPGPQRPTPSTQRAPVLSSTSISQDQQTGDIMDVNGMVLAYGEPPGSLPLARERRRAYDELVQLTEGRALDVSVEPGERDFRLDEQFSLMAEGLYGRHLILVNLAGNGTVQFLFPRGNVDPLMQQDQLAQRMRATKPFGADTMIVIATKDRSNGLEADLAALDQSKAPANLAETIAAHLGSNDRMGLATYTTQ